MKCPKCANAMEKISHQGIEVDRCVSCSGLWFDTLEHENLSKLSGAEVIDTGSANLGKSHDANDRISCPVCNVPLINMVVSGQPHINYEACTVCYGVFFDAGEFSDFKNETFLDSLKAVFAKPRHL